MVNIRQTCVLRVRIIDNCKECFVRLKQRLLKINGIAQVTVNRRKNLVQVESEIEFDPMDLINKINERGQYAELVHDIEEIKGAFDENYQEEIHEDKNEKSKAKSSCSHNKCGHKAAAQPQSHHEPENFVPAPREFPEHICRDKHCRIHRRDDSFLYDRMPPMNYATPMSWGPQSYPSMSWGPQNYGGYPPPPPYGQNGPRMAPPGYGGGMPGYYGPRMAPPPMADYGGGPLPRPMYMPRNDGLNHFSDEYSQGCKTM